MPTIVLREPRPHTWCCCQLANKFCSWNRDWHSVLSDGQTLCRVPAPSRTQPAAARRRPHGPERLAHDAPVPTARIARCAALVRTAFVRMSMCHSLWA